MILVCLICYHFIFFNTSLNKRITKASKLFFLTTMTLELSKYLNQLLDVVLHVKQKNEIS